MPAGSVRAISVRSKYKRGMLGKSSGSKKVKGQTSIYHVGHQEGTSFSGNVSGSRKGQEGKNTGVAEGMTTCPPRASSSAGRQGWEP